MKNRKYTLAGIGIILLIGVFVSLPQKALADPPQDLVLSYDSRTQTLTATITHSSTFTSLHYIKQVIVKKNNDLVSKNDYRSQAGKTSFAYTYQIPAVENDLLDVTVVCNIQGSKTATLKIAAPKN